MVFPINIVKFLVLLSPNFSYAQSLPYLTSALPSLDPNDVKFYIFPDSENPNESREIVYGDRKSLKSAGIVRNKPIRIHIHGFLDSANSMNAIALKNAYLKRKYKNIIIVDWGKLSGNTLRSVFKGPLSNLILLYYPFGIKATKIVGNRLAKFIIYMKKYKIIKNFNSIYLTGHSLGAHIAGITGYRVQEYTKKKIGKIMGIDPAGPFYWGRLPPSIKLSKQAAKLVEVIHSDVIVYGTGEELGHLDYFANGGFPLRQENCTITDLFGFCAHGASLNYFQRAILGEKMFGCPCRRKIPGQTEGSKCLKPRRCRKVALFGPKTPINPRWLLRGYYLPVSKKIPASIKRDYEPIKVSL